MSLRDALFIAIGIISAASAILAVASRTVLHAALWLVVCLGTLAGCYLVLGAELIALVQLLVYVGGVVVIVLFALMLTRSGPDDASISTSKAHRVLAGVVAGGITVLLGTALVTLVGWDQVDLAGPSNADIAGHIFDTWVWPFELLSLVLLLALIAAIAVARGAGTTEDLE